MLEEMMKEMLPTLKFLPNKRIRKECHNVYNRDSGISIQIYKAHSDYDVADSSYGLVPH